MTAASTDGGSSRDQRRARTTRPRQHTGGPNHRGAGFGGLEISSPIRRRAHAPQGRQRGHCVQWRRAEMGSDFANSSAAWKALCGRAEELLGDDSPSGGDLQ
jgi:hypothetical protein